MSRTGPARGRGAPGATPDWSIETEVWILRPANESSLQSGIAKELARELSRRGDVKVEDVVAQEVKGVNGRSKQVLAPSDLRKLYVRCHRAYVWIFATAGMHVRLDPAVRSLERKNVGSLEQVVRYKAVDYFIVSRGEEVSRYLSLLLQERDRLVEGPQDPRCLPLHAFSPQNAFDLAEEEGRRRFTSLHRKKSSRKRGTSLFDVAGREWQVADAMHSADTLHVGGCYLPTGFHWDVQTGRKRTVFVNGWERWETSNGAYLNVHPDGHVRAPRATRTWTWEKS